MTAFGPFSVGHGHEACWSNPMQSMVRSNANRWSSEFRIWRLGTKITDRLICGSPEEAKSANGVLIKLPYPTDDVRLMTKAAVDAVDRVFRPGFKYSKAEVLLLNLCQQGEYTADLFSISQPVATEKVMSVLDSINQRWGRGTLRLASVPTNPDWGMRREMMSQSFTTRVDQLWTVYCR
ncbi:hypothetical protein ABIA55_003358 [Pseudomonas frederiksbergensis]